MKWKSVTRFLGMFFDVIQQISWCYLFKYRFLTIFLVLLFGIASLLLKLATIRLYAAAIVKVD
jgi:hypothetical protein